MKIAICNKPLSNYLSHEGKISKITVKTGEELIIYDDNPKKVKLMYGNIRVYVPPEQESAYFTIIGDLQEIS